MRGRLGVVGKVEDGHDHNATRSILSVEGWTCLLVTVISVSDFALYIYP
jgi:hypothetical protein